MTGTGKDPVATSPAVFLEHQSYRRRRLMDVARLLPLLGAALFAVPLLWPGPKATKAGESDGLVAMSDAITYVFVVWGALIAASVLFGFGVRYWARPDTQPEKRQD